ncbi:MAG TPA: tetratricopeptide repeat protein [Candidatus Paceibacterota bacterium]|nr:tetratricopeptide repeat protein [Candidatus Paceibacterota bacterium]
MGMFTPQTSTETDPIARSLQRAATVVSIFAVSLLPLIFVPIQGVPVFDGKIYLAALGVSIALVFSALLVLRVGSLTVPTIGTLAAGWAVVLVSALSAALSSDVSDSLLTLSGGAYTTVTLMVAMLMMTVVMVLAQTARAGKWLLSALMGSVGLLMVWHTLRLLTGSDLSFGLFPQQTSSVAGGWNDVAILAAGFVLAALLTVGHAGLKNWLRWLLFGGVLLSLFILVVINNSVLWSLLGIVSLTIVVMAISRRQVETTPSLLQQGGSGWLLALAGAVFSATLIVLFGGSVLQNALNTATDSAFVEVRPSIDASLDIVRGVWSEDALTGVGPAKYQDAWRVHKSESINTTIFWNTNFGTGHNFMLTQAVEVGVLGLLAWFAFFGAFIVSGVRTFLTTATQFKDTHYQLALTAYVLAFFVWVCLFTMNPGVPVFLIAAALTGAYLGLSLTLRPRRVLAVSILKNQRLGFVLVASLVVILIGVLWFLQLMTQQVIAATIQNQALQTTEGEISDVTDRLANALTLSRNDNIARTKAQIHLRQMQSLLQVVEPTAEQQEAFQFATRDAAEASQVAVALDPTNPANWYARAQVFTTLAQAQVEGAAAIARDAIEQAAALDPKNPQPWYLEAELAVVEQDVDTARTAVTEAISRKPDYTPALFLLAQLEIAEGNVEDAITVTESIISFDRNNPARYYQLGVLYQSIDENEQAIAALSRAIGIDADYANALYIRGVLYAVEGNQDAAVADLARVLELNPESELVEAQLEAIRSGSIERSQASNEAALEELDAAEPAQDADSLSEAAAETDLITTTTNAPETDGVEEATPAADEAAPEDAATTE